MGAISYEIVHLLNVKLSLLKVKLSLQNDQRWLLLLSCFSKFSGEDPHTSPYRLKNMCFIFQTDIAQHKPLLKSKAYS